MAGAVPGHRQAMPERTPDGRYIVVDGRRWRAGDPGLPEERRTELVGSHGRDGLRSGRARVRRHPP
jgi:hypothetical protein